VEAPDGKHTTANRHVRFNIRVVLNIAIQDCEAGSSGRGTGTDRGEKGFDDTRSGRDEKFDFGKVLVDYTDRDCQISRLVLEAGATDRTIVVVASVSVVMKGHREGGKHY
jgi:hypothetical protein